MSLTPIAIHAYMGQIITRNCNPSGLKWQCYYNGTFIYADTLAGIKRLIREYVQSDWQAGGWHVRF